MDHQANEWTLKGLLHHFQFVHEKMPDHRFAWVLGAGASKQSEIPTGVELASLWLKEIQLRFDTAGDPIEKWATEANVGIRGFDYRTFAAFYPQIFERRFRDHPEEGFAYLENAMAGKEPSPGYSILAKAMEGTRHRVAITTNFDNLIADALSIYTETVPFVCGHESLTPFVRSAMRRPIVCKIHRDLLLGPKNDPRSLKRLHEAWAGTLRVILEQHTPIFVGYGGNDDSLMDLLESLSPGEIRPQMVWCYYNQGRPSDRIRELVRQHNGVLVAVPDFDSLLILLGKEMGLQPLDLLLGERANQRSERYRERLIRLDTTKNVDLAVALAETYERYGGWFTWELKARAEKDPERKETIYLQALQVSEKSVEIRIEYARLLWQHLQRPDEAEKFFEAALDLDADSVETIFHFAIFLWRYRRTLERAEQFLRRANELGHHEGPAMLAYFLATERAAPEADLVFEALTQQHNDDERIIGMYAHYLIYLCGRSAEAEQYLRGYLDRVDTRPATVLLALATAIGANNPQESAALLWEALRAEPENPNVHHGLALHAWRIEKNSKLAERHFGLSLERDENADVRANFVAFFLGNGRIEEAMKIAAKAVEPPAFEQSAAELKLYMVLMAASKQGNVEGFLIELRRMLDGGYPRSRWSFDEVLNVARSWLSPDDCDFYRRVSEAIVDREAYNVLKGQPRWLALRDGASVSQKVRPGGGPHGADLSA